MRQQEKQQINMQEAEKKQDKRLQRERKRGFLRMNKTEVSPPTPTLS